MRPVRVAAFAAGIAVTLLLAGCPKPASRPLNPPVKPDASNSANR